MNRSPPGLPVHHQLLEFTQTHVHWVGDAIQPSHSLSSPSPPAPNPSQHQGLFHESTLHMRWPKYWSFSLSISPSNEHPGLISFRMDWLDLLSSWKELCVPNTFQGRQIAVFMTLLMFLSLLAIVVIVSFQSKSSRYKGWKEKETQIASPPASSSFLWGTLIFFLWREWNHTLPYNLLPEKVIGHSLEACLIRN